MQPAFMPELATAHRDALAEEIRSSRASHASEPRRRRSPLRVVRDAIAALQLGGMPGPVGCEC